MTMMLWGLSCLSMSCLRFWRGLHACSAVCNKCASVLIPRAFFIVCRSV